MSRGVLFIGVSLLLFSLCGGSGNALAESAREIIEKSEAATRGDTLVGEYSITVKTRRWERTMALTYQEKRLERLSFIEIHAPRQDAGNRFLLLGNDMWHFIQRTQSTIRISPSMMMQAWMGSDFTNDDIVNASSLVDDYSHAIIGEAEIDGYPSYKVELLPLPNAPVVWGKVIYYARVSDYLPVRQKFYNAREELIKVLYASDFREMDGRVIPTHYKMKPTGDEDRYTILEINEIKFNADIPDRVFSRQYLTRR